MTRPSALCANRVRPIGRQGTRIHSPRWRAARPMKDRCGSQFSRMSRSGPRHLQSNLSSTIGQAQTRNRRRKRTSAVAIPPALQSEKPRRSIYARSSGGEQALRWAQLWLPLASWVVLPGGGQSAKSTNRRSPRSQRWLRFPMRFRARHALLSSSRQLLRPYEARQLPGQSVPRLSPQWYPRPIWSRRQRKNSPRKAWLKTSPIRAQAGKLPTKRQPFRRPPPLCRYQIR